ncbi:hypothetical protein [Burkholderia sp. NLJ2]|uniref:hypothetical protein n=1 Tax=Burkholderia sp. NLJ2 TaxID=3090699 RepID=UPI003C6C27B9
MGSTRERAMAWRDSIPDPGTARPMPGIGLRNADRCAPGALRHAQPVQYAQQERQAEAPREHTFGGAEPSNGVRRRPLARPLLHAAIVIAASMLFPAAHAQRAADRQIDSTPPAYDPYATQYARLLPPAHLRGAPEDADASLSSISGRSSNARSGSLLSLYATDGTRRQPRTGALASNGQTAGPAGSARRRDPHRYGSSGASGSSRFDAAPPPSRPGTRADGLSQRLRAQAMARRSSADATAANASASPFGDSRRAYADGIPDDTTLYASPWRPAPVLAH